MKQPLLASLAALGGALTLSVTAPFVMPAGNPVGRDLPEVEIEGLAGTPAKSFEDFTGRAILIEFFAYW